MFDKVVFAGGGLRCWWQAGFWEVLRAEIELRPRVIGATSMGAFMACLVYANDSRRALAWYERELAGVRTNLTWLNLFKKDAPLFRQGAIYRKAMRAILGGEHFRQLMWQAPEIRVMCALPSPALSAHQLALLAWREYRRDARLQPVALHARSERAAVCVPHVKRLQDCRTERDLFDLLQAAAALPPLMSPVELDGAPACSGSLLDPVPVDLVADVPGQTLVLTTRPYNRKAPVFAMEGRLYVQPSVPLAAASWDFTSPRRFLKTYEQGRADAESFLRLFALGSFRQQAQFGGALLLGSGWEDESGAAPSPDGEAGVDATKPPASGSESGAREGAAAAGQPADGADAGEEEYAPRPDLEQEVRTGRRKETGQAADDGPLTEELEDVLTLTDDRTLGEPHDKLFERARQAREGRR